MHGVVSASPCIISPVTMRQPGKKCAGAARAPREINDYGWRGDGAGKLAW
jgi:hypothetical protein